MRVAVLVVLSILFSGCVTQAPRQYLDENTAATITVVTNPWIFVSDDAAVAFDKRGYLSLYAFDVNQVGSHQRYLAVLQTSFGTVLPDEKSSTPVLEIQAGGRKLQFQSTPQTLLELGSSRPIDKPITVQSRWWYFAVDNKDLATIAQLPAPRAVLVANDTRFSYVEFRNGSKELMALSAALE